VQEFDPRIIELSIEVDGVIKTYTDLYIKASGSKFANANQNTCNIQIDNLTKNTRDYILTETSPLNRNRRQKRVVLKAGRKSYGTSVVYSGNVVESTPSQPPDIGLSLKCLTAFFFQGEIIKTNQSSQTKLSDIAGQAANSMNLGLNFQAKDISVGNYTYSGSALRQVDKINNLSSANAFIDDDMLIVKDADKPLTNIITLVNAESGMIGIPEITERGVKVKFLLDNKTRIGGTIRVNSKINPAANGDYTIYKLDFDIATRDTPFYYTAEGMRPFL